MQPHRSSSIPRNYRRIPPQERFSVADAAQLKLKLQALDDKLGPDVDLETLKSACQPRPFHEEIYVDGSEEFFLLVKGIARADLIPDTYIEAYAALQQGRFPLNHFRVSEFTKGVDPTFSEMRRLLAPMDELCGTKLDGSLRALEAGVKPFPFLQLPAELALQIYAHLLPREAHMPLLSPAGRAYKPPRICLDIMRTNHQLHAEVTKYFYQNRTLRLQVGRDEGDALMSHALMLEHYETLAVMRPQTRALFTSLDISIQPLSLGPATQAPIQRYPRVVPVADPMCCSLALLPNLATVVLSLANLNSRPWRRRGVVAEQRIRTLQWLLECIPSNVQVLWTPSTSPSDDAAQDVKTCWRIMKEKDALKPDV